MVPSVYIEVDKLPLNITSGKLNVKALNAMAEKQRKAISNPNVTDRHHRDDNSDWIYENVISIHGNS